MASGILPTPMLSASPRISLMNVFALLLAPARCMMSSLVLMPPSGGQSKEDRVEHEKITFKSANGKVIHIKSEWKDHYCD